MTCGDKLWSFRSPFRHSDTIVSDGMQRQIMVILRLLSSRGGGPDDKRRQIMVIPQLYVIRKRSCPMARRDKLWSFCTFLPSADDRVRWHGEINCGHSAPFRHLETIVSDGTQRQIMVILHPFVIQRQQAR